MPTFSFFKSFFSSSYILFTLLLLLITYPSTSALKPSHVRPSSFTKIFAFGDSYTDTGNTDSNTGPTGFNYVSNLPYGITFFHHPTNRYSDGRLIIDFVASSLSLPFLPPYLKLRGGGQGAAADNGVNFAVAGSTAIEHEFFVKNNLSFDATPESILTQLSWFDEFLKGQGCEEEQGCKALIDDALFWIGEIGANDYAYTAETSISSSLIQALTTKRIATFLEAILNKGAKYVVVQGLPATGCLSLALSLSPSDDRDTLNCVKSVNQQSLGHNTILQAELRSLRKQFPEAVIVYADYWNAHAAILKTRSQLGFKEPFKACCGSGGGPYNFDIFNGACGSPSSSSCHNPSEYINWDGVHLTEAMYKAVANAFLHGNYSHPSFRYLLRRQQQGRVRTSVLNG
ncbi:hypothetical protein Ancab_035687 [Ancistrocladus abbreviatus]